MADIRTTYLGLELQNPIIVSSGPLTASVESCVKLEKAGAGAVVMRSIFEESIAADAGAISAMLADDTSMAAMEYMMADLPGQLAAEKYIDTLKAIRERISIPLIASINCIKADSWVAYTKKLESAGIDALEINLYHMPVDPTENGAAVEERRLDLIKAVLAQSKVPVSIKLSKHYTSLLAFTRRLDQLGVGGLVLFNRFLQTNVNTDSETIYYAPDYSSSKALHSQLRWTAIVRDWFRGSIAISGGIHTADDLVKALLVGADAGCIYSVLHVQRNRNVISEMLAGLKTWMEGKGYNSLDDFRGKLKETNLTDGNGFERMQYVRASSRITL